jgi:ligand-binding sensor domain-containing protein/signal transduction histidine kinase
VLGVTKDLYRVTKRKPLLLEGFLLICIWVFFLLAFSTGCLALAPTKPLRQCRLAMWNQQNGLLQDSVIALAQTPDGFLWVASEEGLVRFDGAEFFVPGEFQQKTLLGRIATSLYVDSAGQLWMGSYAGIYCRPRKGKFEHFDQKSGLPSHAEVSAIAADEGGTIWIGTGQAGLFRKDGSRFVEFAPAQALRGQQIIRIFPAKSGELWVAASGGLYRVSNSGAELIKKGLTGKSINGLTADPSGRLWVATNDGLFYIENDRVRPIEWPISRSAATALFTDSHGMIWVGFRDGEIWRMLPDPRIGDAESRPLISVTDGRMNSLVSGFCEDSEGDIWIASDAGLFRISDTRFTVLNSKQGLPSDVVYSVLASRTGKVWVGTDTGLSFLATPSSTHAAMVEPISPILTEEITALYEDAHDHLWVGTSNGFLQLFHQAPFSVAAQTIQFSPAAQVAAICTGLSDDVWVGTGGAGLYCFHDGKVVKKLTDSDGIAGDIVHALAPGPDGTLWIAPGRGLLKYKDGKLEDAIRKDSVAHDRGFVSLLLDSEGTMWAGTFGYGLARIRNGSAERLCDTTHGLFSDEFFTLLKDDKGNLWASSNRGIFAMQISELNEFFDGKRSTASCRRFTASDGLVTAECTGGNTNTSCRTSDGRLWFTTVGGVAITSRETLVADSRSPPIVLERLMANLTRYIPFRPAEPPIVLGPDVHSIEIHYAGLSLSAPENLQYQYRLQGFDPGWVDAGTRRVAYYTNLPPGDYRFEVIARNRDGIWTPKNLATSGEFVVQPHYYQTWWFLALCTGLIGLAIFGLYRWRLHQILQERARLARDLHDTLAQGLVGILWQTESAIKSGRKGQGAETIQILERMSTLVRETLMEARGALKALRSGILAESSSLIGALEKAVKKGASGTSLKTEVRVQGQPFRVRSDWEQALVRITQEALANCIKHANAARFEIELNFERKGLKLLLQDDGVGLEKSSGNIRTITATSSGLGILGMKERCKALGGDLRILSPSGKGTVIQVIVPSYARLRRRLW